MRKVIIASDSFKGTLSSVAISTIFKRVWNERYPDCEVIAFPIADGGEGTCECFDHLLRGKWVKVETVDANWNPIIADYFLFGDKAIIEMSSVVGLPNTKIKNPIVTTTYGLGKLVKNAVENGAKTIVIGMGGTSTNDAGCGFASSLGVVFKNEGGKEFVPTGGTLKDIKYIEIPNLLDGIKIIGMSDVKNPLYGANGAAYVYAPQKGADEAMVKTLDDGLMYLGENVSKELSAIPGAGAAGGFGFGLMAFFNAELKSGIETVLDIADFDDALKDSDLVISGEGRLDSQSFSGKVIDGICKRTKAAGVPLTLIVGSVTEEGLQIAKEHGIESIYITTPLDASKDDMIDNAGLYYENTVNGLIDSLNKH